MRRLPLVIVLAAAPAAAGPPYVTDDPQPTDFKHYEVYFFASGSAVSGSVAGGGGIDFNYGGLKDVQLTTVVPLAFDSGDGGRHVGAGNVELAIKYKVLHQDREAFDLSLFPRVFLPTGGHRFGPGRTALLLPLWAEKDWGKWSLFGGGGWQLNPGGRDFFSGGLAISRALGERASVGAEVYHHGPDARDTRSFTGVNLGATYRLSKHWSVIGSGGPGLENTRSEGQFATYVALKADY